MFEFSLAKAINEGAEVILASAAVQSNYCRQLAIACSKLGLKAHLVLRNTRGEQDYLIQGNLLLDLLAGASVEIVSADVRNRNQVRQKALEELQKQGYERVYLCRGTKDDEAFEGIAYVNCGLELADQLDKAGIVANYVYTASLDTTQAGLLLANKVMKMGWKIVGISPFGEELEVREPMALTINRMAALLDVDVDINADDIVNYQGFAGDGYGRITKDGLEAIKLVAQSEGIFLDPVYSAKAMSALISHIQSELISMEDTVIFLHTGGFPSLFAYNEELKVSDRLTIDDDYPFL